MKMGQSSSLWWDRSMGYVFICQLICLPLRSKKGWRLSPGVSQQPTCCTQYPVFFFYSFLSSGNPLLKQNGWIKYFLSSFFTFPIVPSRGRETLDSGKGVGEKCYSDSLSHACCSKVRRVVSCLSSCQNCWSSRPLRSKLRELLSSFLFSLPSFHLFTLFYDGVTKLRCQRECLPTPRLRKVLRVNTRSLTAKKILQIAQPEKLPQQVQNQGWFSPSIVGAKLRLLKEDSAGTAPLAPTLAGHYCKSSAATAAYTSVTDVGDFSWSAFKKYQVLASSHTILWAFCFRQSTPPVYYYSEG